MVGLKLSENTLNRLECPICRSPIRITEFVSSCCNTECGMQYPIIGGVPVIINDATSVFSIDDFLKGDSTFFKKESVITRLLKRLIPSISYNLASKNNYRELKSLLLGYRLPHRPRILVLGGSIIGDGFSSLANDANVELVETDVSFGPRTALICDAHDIPFASETFDAVVAQAVLEHVADPYRCVSEIWRVLKPQGLVYAETAFMQQVHGGAYDFMRFTPMGHRTLFRHFSEIESGVACGPGMALAWSWRNFLRSFSSNPRTRLLLTAVAHMTSFFLKYFDRALMNNSPAAAGASAVWYLGSKSSSVISFKDLVKKYNGE